MKRADAYPRASEVIPEIIEMVEEGLIEKGYAYESSGDVYFRTEISRLWRAFREKP